MPVLWVVAPSYHDTPSFLRVREELARALTPTGLTPRFVLIDDSAGQDSAASLAALQADTRVMTLPYNHGHQAALVFGLRQLRPEVKAEDYVMTLDADGEDRPEDAPALLAPLLAAPENLHLVALAQRTYRRESLPFKLSYLAFKLAFRVLTGRVIRNGNFVAFRGKVLAEVLFHPHFDFAYASAFISLPLPTAAVPLPRGERFEGESKMGFMNLFIHGLRMFLPFSEVIAARGILASVAVLPFAPPLGILGLGLSGMLFVSFAQTKSRALRAENVLK